MRWLTIFSGLLTPLIAIITTYIAFQQWQGNKLKLKMDRYERRLRINEEVAKMFQIVCGNFKPEWQEIFAFGAATAEADFLFGPEIPEYIRQISSRAAKLRAANAEYRDLTQKPPPGYDHNKVTDEIGAQSKWFTEQIPVAKGLFGKYLNIS